MKLYTEEEIRKFFTEKYDEGLSIDELIEILTPIEIPSDEEVGKKAFDDFCDGQFIDGAKWMRDKIQGSGQ